MINNSILIGFNADTEEISIYSNPCVSPEGEGLSVILIIAVAFLIAVLSAYFVLISIQKFKLYLFADRNTSMNLTNSRSDHLPEGRESDWLYLKLFHQWMQQALNARNPRDIFDPRFQGRTYAINEAENIRNRNIYSSNWGISSLTDGEKSRLRAIANTAYNNGSLQAWGYEIRGGSGAIIHRGNGMTAKSRIALIAIIAANDRRYN